MENDYLIRQIQEITRVLANAVFHKEDTLTGIIDEQGEVSEEGLLDYVLHGMVLDGRINEAENLLFEKVRTARKKAYLEAAVNFYGELAALDGQTLRQCNYTRAEIAEGLQSIAKLYGITDGEDGSPSILRGH